MKKFFASLLEDNAGGFSSIRLLMLAWSGIVMVTWCFVAVRSGTIPDIPTGVITFTGMVIGGKVAQRFGEGPAITNTII